MPVVLVSIGTANDSLIRQTAETIKTKNLMACSKIMFFFYYNRSNQEQSISTDLGAL